jgi:hypothetical protein
MRRDGEISYTYFGQTIMYLKQELARDAQSADCYWQEKHPAEFKG